MSQQDVKPEDCPEKANHANGPFRYCPYCSWTEADDAPPCPSVFEIYLVPYTCESYVGHAGEHYRNFLHNSHHAKLVWA